MNAHALLPIALAIALFPTTEAVKTLVLVAHVLVEQATNQQTSHLCGQIHSLKTHWIHFWPSFNSKIPRATATLLPPCSVVEGLRAEQEEKR